MPPGAVVQAQDAWNTVAGPEQLQELEARTAQSHRALPAGPTAVVESPRALGDPALLAGLLEEPAAVTIYRDSVIPPSGIVGGYARSSNVQEPSTGVHGSIIFQTGNWYASRSFDNGSTWSPLDPATLFGPGFCCDQVTLYEPVRDHQFWLLQYGDHLTLANSGGSDLASWCNYAFTPASIGEPPTTVLDYNDIALSNNYLYIAVNVFPVVGQLGSAVLRLPLDPMVQCAGFSYVYLNRAGGLTWKPVQGATDAMYWGTNWNIPGMMDGASFRVYSWPEVSGDQIFVNDYTIDSFAFYVRNSGQNCASQDGVVTNWCAFSDSRVLGGYRASGVIGFSFNAKQDGAHPFPYSRRVYFNEADLSYLRSDDLWATNAALLFLSLAPDGNGDVGGSFAFGGGTGTDHFYPGGAVMIEDATTPTPPWDVSFFLFGQGNTCTDGGLPRWGDYLTVRPNNPDPATWVATNYAIIGGNCGVLGFSEPHNVMFGR